MAENKKKKRKAVAPKDETPEQRTKRLAEYRVSRAVKNIKAIGNLGGSAYTLTEAQKETIIAALQVSVKEVEAMFLGQSSVAAGFVLGK